MLKKSLCTFPFNTKLRIIQGVAFQTVPPERTWDFLFCYSKRATGEIRELKITFLK